MAYTADKQRQTIMIEMRREGKTLREVGEHFGITYERVRQLLQDTEVNGLRGKTKAQKRAEYIHQEIERLWNEEKSMREIANQLELSEDSVRSYMMKMRRQGWNLPYRPRARARYREIKRLWDEGESIKSIAQKFRTTKGTISVTMVRMRKSGWDLPYRHPMKISEGKR